jgi:dienelactone hydrolase
MDRRDFLRSATLATAATATSAAFAQSRPAGSQLAQAANPPAPAVKNLGEPQMRRWTEQRWALDNLIRANGIDWDQPRTAGLISACGPESQGDVAGIRNRVQKFADITPAFEAVARRREAIAHAADEAKNQITARDSYFMAAQYWASAQWPIDQNSEQNLFFNQKKRECFTAYGKLADHYVEAVWLPLPSGQRFPGWFHLPPNYSGERIPAVVSIPGMDGFKERSVALYGDRWLSRGVAVLAIEGPGQYECPTLGVYVNIPAWVAAGRAAMDWLAARSEIDSQRVGITGASFGSLFATISAGSDSRYRAVAVSATCLEPGCHTIFQEASPTFKKRFMYMSGMTDEAAFDQFRQSLTWEGFAEKIKAPYLCIAGEADELCPLEQTERMFKAMQAPRNLVVYAGSRHSVGNVPSTSLGPSPSALAADWMLKRFAGETFPSERWFIDATGRINKTAL